MISVWPGHVELIFLAEDGDWLENRKNLLLSIEEIIARKQVSC